MNFISHIHIADRAIPYLRHQTAGPGPDTPERPGPVEPGRQPEPAPAHQLLLGAALPDLASIGRFRLARRPDRRWLALGVEVHHRTDEAFHHHPWFLDHGGRLRNSLLDQGLGRGPARAVGHVGIELLLDGRLLARQPALRRTTRSVLTAAGHPSLELANIVSIEHRPEWHRHLSSVAGWHPAPDHHEPVAVARRLHRLLRGRPRLAFDEGRTPLVAQALETVLPTMSAGIPAMVTDVVEFVIDRLDR